MKLIKITNPEGLTLKEIRSILEDEKFSDLPVFNSCFAVDYTEKILKRKSPAGEFEPIDGIYEDCGIIAVYSFEKKYNPLTVKEFLSKLPDDPELTIERDVDDGFRYEAYETMLVSEKLVVFC
jgi:hypothetical protein